jgi:hypothetical protein
MTMRYVHHVEEHYRPIPEHIVSEGAGVLDPDQRILVMLGARTDIVRGNSVATKPVDAPGLPMKSAS